MNCGHRPKDLLAATELIPMAGLPDLGALWIAMRGLLLFIILFLELCAWQAI